MPDSDAQALTLAGLRVRNLDEIVERLDDPKTVAGLLDLLDNVETLNGALTILQGFFSHGEHMLDNVAGAVREFVGDLSGTPTAATIRNGVKLAGQSIPLVNAAADSGIVEKAADPELLALAGALLDGVKHAAEGVATRPGPPITAFGLLRALKDPDVNRGIDFALRVLKEVGRSVAPAAAH